MNVSKFVDLVKKNGVPTIERTKLGTIKNLDTPKKVIKKVEKPSNNMKFDPYLESYSGWLDVTG